MTERRGRAAVTLAAISVVVLGGCVLELPHVGATPDADLPCNPVFVRNDPADDVRFGFLLDANPPSPAMDLLRLTMAATDEGIAFSAWLAGDPREEFPVEYWYWLELPVDHDNNGPFGRPKWTMQSTFTYDVIVSMNMDNRSEYPVTWNGTEFSFVVPWHAFEEQYESDWPFAVFDPKLVAQGPHTPGVVSQQFVGFDDHTEGSPVKAMYGECATATDLGPVAAAARQEAPGGPLPGLLVAIAALLAAARSRWRRG